MTTDDEHRGRGRKERVIHTRVPINLDHELKQMADALRIPVSNLVRNILHDAMTAVDQVGRTVEDLVDDVKSHVGSETDQLRRTWARYEARPKRAADPSEQSVTVPTQAREEPVTVPADAHEDPVTVPVDDAPPADPLEAVYGFQPVLLNVAASCAVCGRSLGRGETAHVGLTDRSGPRLFVCSDCLPRPDDSF